MNDFYLAAKGVVKTPNWLLVCLVLVFSAILVLYGKAQSSSRRDTLSGIVTDTVNMPISGVGVSLTMKDAKSQVTVRTGQDGKFVIAVVPGRYGIELSREGFYRTRAEKQSSITVVSGQILPDLRLQMHRTSVITGRVLDESYHPRTGMDVALVKPYYENGRHALEPTKGSHGSSVIRSEYGDFQRLQDGWNAKTDENGQFRISGVEAGDYYLVSSPNFLGGMTALSYVPEFFPGVTDPADAVLINVTDSDIGGLNFQFRQHPLYTATFHLSSSIDALQDEILQLVLHSRNGMDTTLAVIRRALPNMRRSSDGGYITPGLPPGSYEIYYFPTTSHLGRLSFTIADRDVNAGTLVVEENVNLDLRVRGNAQLPDSASMSLVPDDDRYSLNRVTLGSRIHPNGTFGFPGVGISKGHYYFDITGLSPNAYIASAMYGSRSVLETGLLIDAVPSGPLELTINEPGGTVLGSVEAANKEPIVGATVVLLPSTARRKNPIYLKTAVTDQLGRFSINGIAPGTYGILAWEDIEPGAWQDAELLKRYEQSAKALNIMPGLVTNVDLLAVKVVTK